MKTQQPGRNSHNETGRTSSPAKQGATNPKKPNNDPDQTPEREVENLPKAKPATKTAPGKNKPGFHR